MPNETITPFRHPKIFIGGSLRNPNIPIIAAEIRKTLPDAVVFDDWFSGGPEADDCWRAYEKARGHDLAQAVKGPAAQNIFQYDRRHILESDAYVLILPAGRSGHLELGFAVGNNKRGYILMDEEPDRYDVMYAFADEVFYKRENLYDQLFGVFSNVQYPIDGA
jgi:hypothetical protein